MHVPPFFPFFFFILTFSKYCIGPSIAVWYSFLQRNVAYQSSIKTLLSRVALDQCLFAPTFIGIFFYTNAYLEGMDHTEIQKKLKQVYNPILHIYYIPLFFNIHFDLELFSCFNEQLEIMVRNLVL